MTYSLLSCILCFIAGVAIGGAVGLSLSIRDLEQLREEVRRYIAKWESCEDESDGRKS